MCEIKTRELQADMLVALKTARDCFRRVPGSDEFGAFLCVSMAIEKAEAVEDNC